MRFKIPGGHPPPVNYEPPDTFDVGRLTTEALPEAVADVLTDLKAMARGDAAAAKTFLDHVHSKPKPSTPAASIPGFTKALNQSLTDAAMLVAKAIGTGKVKPTVGREILASLSDVANIKKVDQIEAALTEIDERLRELQEQKSNKAGGHSAVDFVQGLVLIEIDDSSAPGGRRDTWADEQGNQVACILPVWGPGGARARERAVELGLREPRDPGKSIL